MFNYLSRKLGIDDLRADIRRIPSLNERYLKLLTPLENLTHLLLEPEGDDSLVIHKLRSMGYAGGWRAKEQYLKGAIHGKASQAVAAEAEAYRLANTTPAERNRP